MTRERLIALRERRAALVHRAAHERAVIHGLVERADTATAWVGRLNAVVQAIKARPAWVAAGVAVFVLLRPRRALRWAGTGLSLWRTWKSLQPVISRVMDLVQGSGRRPA